MKDAADYLGHIKALIMLNRQVVHWEVIREEAQGDVGLLRYRLTLRDGGLLEMFERLPCANAWVTWPPRPLATYAAPCGGQPRGNYG